jgi:hypothetical protein
MKTEKPFSGLWKGGTNLAKLGWEKSSKNL